MTDTTFSKEDDNPVNLSGRNQSSDDAVIHDILTKILTRWRSISAEEAAAAELQYTMKEPPKKDMLEETIILSVADMKEKPSPTNVQRKDSVTAIEETVIISTSPDMKEKPTDIASNKPDSEADVASINYLEQLKTKEEEKKKSENEDFLAETMILKLPDKDRPKGRG